MAGVHFVYYFKYVAGDLALYATFTLLMRVPQVLGAWLAQHYLKLFKSPGRALSVLYCAYGLLLLANFFVSPASHLMAFWIFTVASSLLFGMSYSLIYIIIPDLVDYGEYLTGVRNDGGVSATMDFANKVGMAIGTSGMGFVLAGAGIQRQYTPNTPGDDGDQRPDVYCAWDPVHSDRRAVFVVQAGPHRSARR